MSKHEETRVFGAQYLLGEKVMDHTCTKTTPNLAGVAGDAGMLDFTVETLRASLKESASLRKALIATGRNIGCLLADKVSTEFLMGIPDEARLVLERKDRERAEAETRAYELGRQTGLRIAANYLEDTAKMALTVIETDCAPEARVMQWRAEEIRSLATKA